MLFQYAFKLTTPGGEELLFQAAGINERDRWAHAIGAVIRSISSSSQVKKCQFIYLFSDLNFWKYNSDMLVTSQAISFIVCQFPSALCVTTVCMFVPLLVSYATEGPFSVS